MLTDQHHRAYSYLRLSLTDACNFSCRYCLPDGYKRRFSDQAFLSADEIELLVRAFSKMGFWKVRLTGGEPTLRRDLIEVTTRIAALDEIKKVCLTTNGFRLKRLAPELKRSGVSSVNVSIDSLDRARFAEITGEDRLNDVLAGVEAALAVGLKQVKINVLLLQDLDWTEFDRFLAWTEDTPITVRFIELMQTGDNREFFQSSYLNATSVQRYLKDQGWSSVGRVKGEGPAVEYVHSSHTGRIGVIAPYSKDFCQSCNRLRVDAFGRLFLCLFAEEHYPLRHLLQSEDSRGELIKEINRCLQFKGASHFLSQGKSGRTTNLSIIGG